MDHEFARSLREDDIETLRRIPKGNMHSHSGKGCSLSYLKKKLPLISDLRQPDRFADLGEMQSWYYRNIGKYIDSREGLLTRWEGCFVEAQQDNLEVMVQSFSRETISDAGGMSEFIRILEGFRKTYTPDLLFLPEITFPRNADVFQIETELDAILDYNYFKSVDICFDEKSQPIDVFKGIYKKCIRKGLVPKAHVGEFGEPDDVMRAAEALGLREIHHGIAASRSDKVMQYLKENDIVLNICPSSNVCLGVTDCYRNHPIRILFDYGITVTVNTDDLLIFGSSVSDEFMNLYHSGVMDADELDVIRCRSLKNAVAVRYGI